MNTCIDAYRYTSNVGKKTLRQDDFFYSERLCFSMEYCKLIPHIKEEIMLISIYSRSIRGRLRFRFDSRNLAVQTL